MTGENAVHDTDARADLLPVVGIGASAGGLAALKQLVRCMPSDTGLTFVVVVHLSPTHESHLAGLLQPHTQMPITQVTETVQMEPDHVYVIPPGFNLTALVTCLRLSELEEERSRRAPIDHFFESLAVTHHKTAIGVILTGANSDGTFGLRRIREHGGLTIAQDPDEAEFDWMPQRAILSGVVDRVLRISEMPAQMVRFARTEPMLPDPGRDEAPRTGRATDATKDPHPRWRLNRPPLQWSPRYPPYPAARTAPAPWILSNRSVAARGRKHVKNDP